MATMMMSKKAQAVEARGFDELWECTTCGANVAKDQSYAFVATGEETGCATFALVHFKSSCLGAVDGQVIMVGVKQ